MTSLTKTVKRETASLYRGRPLVVELHAGYLNLRLKGKRSSVSVDYATVLELGYKLLARAERAEQKSKTQRGASRRRKETSR